MNSFEQAIALIRGNGGAPDWDKIRELFDQAAQAGHPGAQFNLGVMHAKGIGTAFDKQAARRCFEQAAALGHAAAPNVLAQYFQSAPASGGSLASTGHTDTTGVTQPDEDEDENENKAEGEGENHNGQPGLAKRTSARTVPSLPVRQLSPARLESETHPGAEMADHSHRAFLTMLAVLLGAITLILVRGYFSLR